MGYFIKETTCPLYNVLAGKKIEKHTCITLHISKRFQHEKNIYALKVCVIWQTMITSTDDDSVRRNCVPRVLRRGLMENSKSIDDE